MVFTIIGLFIAYVFFSYLFTSSEASKFALRSTEGLSPWAKKFVQNPGSLATLVLGNNKANVLIGQLLGQMVGDVLPIWVQGLPWAVFMLFVTVVFCEYVPKAVGEARPERTLNLFAPVLLISGWGMTPLVCGLTYLKKFLPKLQKNENEEELVEAAQRLDSIEVREIMKAIEPNLLEEDLPKVIFSMRADLALKVVHDEGPQLVINERGETVGLINRHIAFEWLFDHYDD